MRNSIRAVFESAYDLGKVSDMFQFTIGAHNKSFGVKATKDGADATWFVRVYVPGKKEADILYEHALLLYIDSRDDTLVAVPIKAKDGATYTRITLGGQELFFAVFEFLPGDEEKYSWIYNDVPEETLRSAARAVARYHIAAYGFEPPQHCARQSESTAQYMQTWYGFMSEALAEMQGDMRTKFYTDYMLTQMGMLKEAIERALGIRQYEDKLPCMHIHSDIQISNFKYTDGLVSGMFDFDWAKWGERVYDVAYAAKSFCCSWHFEDIGDVNLEKLSMFIREYNAAMRGSGVPMGPLQPEEQIAFPYMLLAGFLRCTYDFVYEFYHDRELNVFQYYMYALRFTRNVRFVMERFEEIRQIGNL